MTTARTSHISWTCAEPERRPADVHGHEVLWQALHEQQGDAAEQPTTGSRTWSDRRPARTCARCAPASVGGRCQEPLRRVQRRAARSGRHPARCCRRPAPRATISRRRSSVQRGRGWMSPRMRGSSRQSAAGRGEAGARRAAARYAAARSSRIRTWPIDSSSPNPSGATDATRSAIDECAVGAAEVLDVPAPTTVRRTACSADANGSSMTIALLTSRPRVVIASRSNERPSSGSPLGDARTISRPSDAPGWRAAARRSVQQRGTTRARKNVEQRQEQQAHDPHHQEQAVHQPTSPATSTTITVSPISIRSPAPSTSSPPGRRSRAIRWCCRDRRRRGSRAGRRSGRGGARHGCRAGPGRCQRNGRSSAATRRTPGPVRRRRGR